MARDNQSNTEIVGLAGEAWTHNAKSRHYSDLCRAPEAEKQEEKVRRVKKAKQSEATYCLDQPKPFRIQT